MRNLHFLDVGVGAKFSNFTHSVLKHLEFPTSSSVYLEGWINQPFQNFIRIFYHVGVDILAKLNVTIERLVNVSEFIIYEVNN